MSKRTKYYLFAVVAACMAVCVWRAKKYWEEFKFQVDDMKSLIEYCKENKLEVFYIFALNLMLAVYWGCFINSWRWWAFMITQTILYSLAVEEKNK